LFTWAFFVAVLFAFLDWASTWKGWKKRLYIAKPTVMVFLIIWTIQMTGWKDEMAWFGAALVFALIGDIALMLNPRYFMVGGVAFLMAHVAYLVGFNQSPAPLSSGVFLVAVLVGVSAAVVFRRIRPGIMRVPRGKRFLTALSLYGISLTLMLLSALLTLFMQDWQLLPAVLAAGGAVLFFASDTMLVYDRFVRKFTHAQSYVHLTYHLAQFAIISGAVLHFLR
jgi:uncharacterized membrane protein YhhN